MRRPGGGRPRSRLIALALTGTFLSSGELAWAQAPSPASRQTPLPGVVAPAERTAPTLPSPPPTAPPSRLNPTGKAMQIVAPLNEREQYLGDVEIRVLPDDMIEVSPVQVLEILARTLDPEALTGLRVAAQPGAFLPIDQYADLGLPMTFEASTLTLRVDIPIAARPRQSVGLAELDRSVYGDFSSPAAVAAYLNVRSSLDYVHEGSDTGFGDATFLSDAAIRVRALVLEGEFSADTSDEGSFRREGTRLVYDDVGRLNRWTVGDLLPQGRGFQGVQDIGGVGVERTYGLLDPQRNVAPRGGRTFTLDRESTVEAYINGRVVRTLRLQPGIYDVNDFPFVSGSNDVQVVVEDSVGRREVLSFSIFVDRTQLARGLSEFGVYVGAASTSTNDRIEYSEGVAGSGFYRRGLTDNLTLGGNFQFSQRGALAGAEGVFGSALGTIGGDIAVSALEDGGAGAAINVTYERLIQDRAGGSSLSASFEARTRRFGPPSQFAPDNRYTLNAAVAYNRSFGDSSFLGGQIRYAMARDGVEDERTLRVTYGRRLTDRLNVIVDADIGSGGFSDGAAFRVALIRRFGGTGSARAEYDSFSERARVGYQTSGGRGVGAWSVAGTLEGGADDIGFNGAAAYAANRAELGLAHTTSYSIDASTIADQRSSFRSGVGLAYADGAVAFGRPVTDGFAIVRPYRSGAAVIEVDPSEDGYYARSGPLGPALYGQLGSYTPRSIVYDAPEAPPGFDIGSGAVRVYAPYRAGYLVTVGSEYGVTAIGRLLDADGQPVALLSGKALEQGGEKRTVDVFTNRNGAFGASGLKAGRWRIELIDGQVYDLVVPDNAGAVVRLGDLKPAP